MAIFLCLVMLFEALPVITFSAKDEDDEGRTLTRGNVTVTGDFPFLSSLSVEELDNPFSGVSQSVVGKWWNRIKNFAGGMLPGGSSSNNLEDTSDDGYLAFYDISVRYALIERHPTSPVTVTISDLDLPAQSTIQVVHILDDADVISRAVRNGKASEIADPAFVTAFPKAAIAARLATGRSDVVYAEYFTSSDGSLTVTDDGKISFVCNSFSVFMITSTPLETTFEASDGNTYEVSVTFDVRANLPADAALTVSEIAEGSTAYNSYVEYLAEELGMEAEDIPYIRLLNISIIGTESGDEYQPASPVTVSVRLKDDEAGAMIANGSVFNVYHFGDCFEELSSETEGDVVTFKTSGFSVFALSSGIYMHTYRFFVPTDASQTAYEEYQIYTDTGTTTFTQVIKAHDELVMPQLPSIANSPTSTFAGWYEGTESNGNVTLNTTEFDFVNLPEITSDRTITLYARFGKFAYVIFHEQYNGTTNTWPIAAT
ncbi:MAG: hypothetical protein J6Z80_00375, partial [Clostridia bacterium]|nr:hypothetical protein [Clostridia bacterium]